MSKKHGEMVTDEEIEEAVATLAAVARRFLPDGWSIHLQCYRGGEVFASLCQLSEQCEEQVVSLHDSYQDAIDAAMRHGNSPEIPGGSGGHAGGGCTQIYRGEVFASLCQLSEQCEERVVSLHETYQDAIDAAMRLGNSPTNLEGST